MMGNLREKKIRKSRRSIIQILEIPETVNNECGKKKTNKNNNNNTRKYSRNEDQSAYKITFLKKIFRC